MGQANFIQSIVNISPLEYEAFDLLKNSIIYSSGLAEKLTGYSKEELIELSKDHFEALVHCDDREKVAANFQRLKQSSSGEVVETIFRIKKADGSYLWVHTREQVYERDEQGRAWKIASVAEDISKKMALEQKLKETVALLDKISYKNSHDVRGPVASILGLIHLISDENLVGEYDKMIIGHLKRLVSKLDSIIREVEQISQKRNFE